jgi:ABC-type uncharacterized transport system permease subunit
MFNDNALWVAMFLYSVLRVSLPMIFAALGGLLAERSGVVNLALEGFMLMGAFMGAVGTLYFHSPWYGFAMAILTGLLMGLGYSILVIQLKLDQIVSGVAVNMLASGIPPFFLKILYGSTASSPAIPFDQRFVYAPLVIGLIVLIVVYIGLQKTSSGLWLKFAGEYPAALDTAGVSVVKVRYMAVMGSGILAAIGGCTLSLYLSSVYSTNITAGRGFMALAALIIGKWRPLQTAAACLLFGFFEVFQNHLQSLGYVHIPVPLVQMIPYVLTLVVLAGFIGKSRPPKFLGQAYSR